MTPKHIMTAAIAALILAAPAAMAGTTHVQTVKTNSDSHAFTLYNSQWTGAVSNAADLLLNEPAGTSLPAFLGVTTILHDATACPNGEYADGLCGNSAANYVRFQDLGNGTLPAGACEILEDYDAETGSYTSNNNTTVTGSAPSWVYPTYRLFGDGLLYAGTLEVSGVMERMQTTNANGDIHDRFATEFLYLDVFDTDFWFETNLAGADCFVEYPQLGSNQTTNLDWVDSIQDRTRYNLV